MLTREKLIEQGVIVKPAETEPERLSYMPKWMVLKLRKRLIAEGIIVPKKLRKKNE